MSKQFVIFLAVGIAVIGVALSVMLVGTKGAHLELTGKILKVRVLPLNEKASLVVVDFRVSNPADIPYVVNTATITLVPARGEAVEGTPIPKSDLDNVFKFEKLIGPAFNDALITRDRVAAHATIDRMTAARFEFPEAEIANRKSLRLKIDEVDGAVAELTESTGKK
jgi:hypothetical protein